MTKYLVTGSTGFIGKRLLGLLRTTTYDVRLLTRSKVNNYDSVICNLSKDRIPKQAFESIDSVIHLAGLAHDIKYSSKDKNLYHAVNVDATVKLARLAVENSIKQFVFVSSVKAGGFPLSKNHESESKQNLNEEVYGISKRMAEIELLKIAKESGMGVSIIRPSLVYGPEVKGNLHLMLSGIKNGWFPPLPETNNKRSMIHVDDLVRAILMVANDDRANGEIFNVTDGTPYSSSKIYDTMCNVIGKSVPKWRVPKFLFDVVSLISPRMKYKINKLFGDELYSSSKLEALGFKAKKSLKDMNETDY